MNNPYKTTGVVTITVDTDSELTLRPNTYTIPRPRGWSPRMVLANFLLGAFGEFAVGRINLNDDNTRFNVNINEQTLAGVLSYGLSSHPPRLGENVRTVPLKA